MPGLTVLIPLDGTRLSESALALLPMLRKLGVETVVLAAVWEALWSGKSLGAADAELKEIGEKGAAYLYAYLDKQAERVRSLGFEVNAEVRMGRVADELLEAGSAADLVLIATHGRDGIARMRLGSVADKVVRHAECPTLVVGPNVDVELEPYEIRRILVPLDGSALAEEALPVAIGLARAAGAELDLVRVQSLVIPGDDTTGMDYSADILQKLEEAARAYLDEIGQRLENQITLRSELLLGNAGEALLSHLTDTPAQLVVLASHGRSGVIRTALGSVADRMLHGPAPVLILRPQQVNSRFLTAVIGNGG